MLRLIRNGFTKMPGHFRSYIWDPKLIIAQIFAIQCQFYVTYTLFVYILDILGRFDASLDQIFTQIVSEIKLHQSVVLFSKPYHMFVFD
jgi:hypothetical protein